ncbi:uncharacterized protein LOC113290364 [Papaver somniferum]|uniref:uncharacterized protein LOC113290364 n=1 Tax=Papaver somniferum TaxID=3469 RepID=UPI000E6F83CA|nr:uncharacterized protein LOC113290364 [Papaver somniferum]
MVAEIFTKLMKQAVELNMTSGFSINNKISVSYLQYVDDTIVLLNGTVEEAENLLIVLQVFEGVTGLLVNLTKISVISIGANHNLQDVAEILHCKIEDFPLKYLGLPVGATCRNFKVEKKLIQIMRAFLWGTSAGKKKINWIAWKRACIPKKAGGLGIRNLKQTNRALIAKWT